MTNKDIEALLNHWHIRGKLLVGDIIAGIGDCRFYYEMDPGFLDKIYKITGTHNGILMNDHKISLIINADTEMDDHPVISFFITFDKHTFTMLKTDVVREIREQFHDRISVPLV